MNVLWICISQCLYFIDIRSIGLHGSCCLWLWSQVRPGWSCNTAFTTIKSDSKWWISCVIWYCMTDFCFLSPVNSQCMKLTVFMCSPETMDWANKCCESRGDHGKKVHCRVNNASWHFNYSIYLLHANAYYKTCIVGKKGEKKTQFIKNIFNCDLAELSQYCHFVHGIKK